MKFKTLLYSQFNIKTQHSNRQFVLTSLMKSLFLQMKAILVGAYEKKDGDNKTLVLTTLGQQVNEKTGGKLVEQLNVYVYMKLIYSHLFFELTELIVHSFHTPVELVH